MTRQLSRQQAVLLAAVVLAGVGLAIWAMFRLADRRGLGNDAFTVEANFGDVGGVEVGTRVRLQGIDAGEVVAVVPPQIPGEQVKLRMLLAGKLRHLVTADARVQIASENLFAGRHVRILPGSKSSGPVADGASLASMPTAELSDVIAHASSSFEVARNKGALSLLLNDDRAAQDICETLALLSSLAKEVKQGNGVLGLLLKDEQARSDLSRTLGRINSMVDDVGQGKGSLGMLLKDPTLYREVLTTLADVKTALGEDVRRLVLSVRQNSDAIKSLPVVRNYVVDAQKELVRPECKRYCKWFSESELFEPGRAVLTTEGRKRLDDAASWVKDHKEVGSEVVIAGFAALNQNPDMAQTLTSKQSEAVCEYLRNNHQIHRTGWWWWSTRSVRSVGVGTNHPAMPESEKLPGSRIELVVFAPGK